MLLLFWFVFLLLKENFLFFILNIQQCIHKQCLHKKEIAFNLFYVFCLIEKLTLILVTGKLFFFFITQTCVLILQMFKNENTKNHNTSNISRNNPLLWYEYNFYVCQNLLSPFSIYMVGP